MLELRFAEYSSIFSMWATRTERKRNLIGGESVNVLRHRFQTLHNTSLKPNQP